MQPPTHIDNALVLEWAWSDVPFGDLRFDDGAVAAVIHGLAICQYEGSAVIYRFSCNATWETEQDADYQTVEEAKALLPEQYRRARADWVKVAGATIHARRDAG